MRKTVRTAVTIKGKGLHSGAPATLRVHPGDDGLIIRRGRAEFTASWDNVTPSALCTLLRSPDDPSASLSTTEHLMAALSALGVTDAVIEVSGPEVPILDGSAHPFLLAVQDAGLLLLPGERERLIIKAPVIVRAADSWAGLFPAERFTAAASIDFVHPAIGHQSATFDPLHDDFASDIAPARTFCMAQDVSRMRAAGLALGGDETNAVVFGDAGPEAAGGLRYPDEPARHKLLDALGDLHLAGAEIIGRFGASRPGHRLTNDLLRALRAAPSAARAA